MAKIRAVFPTNIAKGNYYTLREFAVLTNRTEQSVRQLMMRGNRLRKLKYKHFFGKPFILAEELTEFPFTSSGYNGEVFHYNTKGEAVYEPSFFKV